MAAPEVIERLVEQFDASRHAMKHSDYGETEVRIHFLNPLFEALGWDVTNQRGAPLPDLEVIHEDQVRVGGAHKAPDYGFYAGRERKFFVEAKKPSVNLKFGIAPAYQLRRYAWSARLPVSVLTDFEEFAIYDGTIQPTFQDPADRARLHHIPYHDYMDRWDTIREWFSRDAVFEGSIDRLAAELETKRGKATVDRAFLAEIERWRELLATNIALHNPGLTSWELNSTVQMTVDRIIFLRIAEDRGIEEYGRLQGLCDGTDVYARLRDFYRQADERYNSGLFHFHAERGRGQPDDLTPGLTIDDRVLKDILSHLYYPESPYEFSVLPVDVLGQVYEQFLGKVISVSPLGRVEIEDKPEVRKAGGVYYTPDYIVEYIVRHTVGKQLEGKTPRSARRLKFLDPACGSGSFLLGTYSFLLDWYRDWYVADGPEKHKRAIFETVRRGTTDGSTMRDYRLTTAERKRILLDHVHGVDIDPQAVEVTKLSLLLKLLEGETSSSLDRQLQFVYTERVLPDLERNIKCGNSLIGPEFYKGQMTLFDSDEMRRINAFDWQSEFAGIMAAGGFDAVVGNPPYIRIHNLVDHYPHEVRFIQSRYDTARFGKVDIYVPFVERALEMMKRDGVLGFIVPNKFIQADYGVGLRRLIAEKRLLHELVDFGDAQVFRGASTYTCLLFLSGRGNGSFSFAGSADGASAGEILREAPREIQSGSSLSDAPWSITYVAESQLLHKIESAELRLPDVASLMITGVKTGANDVFVFDEVISRDGRFVTVATGSGPVVLERDVIRPYWKAESLKRYYNPTGERVVLYPYEVIDGKTTLISEWRLKAEYPKAWAYLDAHRTTLEGRQKGKLKGPYWHGHSFASSLEMFDSVKLVTATLSTVNAFSVDTSRHIFPQGAGGGCGIVVNENISRSFLMGVLNSRLLTFHFQRISSAFHGGYYAYEPRYLNRIPIPRIDVRSPPEMAHRDQVIALVDRVLALHVSLRAARTGFDRNLIHRQLEAADRQIDHVVYSLFELTSEEIAVVERGSSKRTPAI